MNRLLTAAAAFGVVGMAVVAPAASQAAPGPTTRSASLAPFAQASAGLLQVLPTAGAASFGNPGQPTISAGSTGSVVRRLQRALRRTADTTVTLDGVFGPITRRSVINYQLGAGLPADGVVGPRTWAALPNGGPMPLLSQGARGAVVQSLQTILTRGAFQWGVSPHGIDGIFGPATAASVRAFQRWATIPTDGVVGDQSWASSLHAANATLESAVGLQFARP